MKIYLVQNQVGDSLEISDLKNISWKTFHILQIYFVLLQFYF